MNNFFATAFATMVLIFPVKLLAQIQCPSPPEQASKDSKVAVQAAVGRLGPIKAGEVSTEVQRTTRDLLSALPQPDRVYLEQMMFSAFCSSIRDNKAMSDTEKSKALREYATEVRRTLSPSAPSKPIIEPNTGPKNQKSGVTQPTSPAGPTANSSFNSLLEVFGLPMNSKASWSSTYSDIEKIIPAEQRVVSDVGVISTIGKTRINGLPARASFFFENKQLVAISVFISTSHSESRAWVVREPPIPERVIVDGETDLGSQVCSSEFFRSVEMRANSRFSKERDVQTTTKADPSFTNSSWECNKYGCTYKAETLSKSIHYSHVESPYIALTASIWKGSAEYSKGSGRYSDGGRKDIWRCLVGLTFRPQKPSGL